MSNAVKNQSFMILTLSYQHVATSNKLIFTTELKIFHVAKMVMSTTSNITTTWNP